MKVYFLRTGQGAIYFVTFHIVDTLLNTKKA